MRRWGWRDAARYLSSFAVAFILHVAMLLGLPAGEEQRALIGARRGTDWVEVEFVPPRRVNRPQPKEKPRLLERLKPSAPPELPRPAPLALPALPVPVPLPARPAKPAIAPEDLPSPVEEETAASGATPTAPGTERGAIGAEILSGSRPEYPVACQLGLHRADHHPCEGTAIFLVEVLEDGRIGRIRMVQSAGCRHLDNSVRRWLRTKARAIPAMRQGKPVRSEILIEVRFRAVEDGEVETWTYTRYDRKR